MASPEQVRRIERWRDEVATLATDLDDIQISEPPAVAAQGRRYVPAPVTKTTPGVKFVSRSSVARPISPIPRSTPKKEPHVVRVILDPSSSEDSAHRYTNRSRQPRNSRSERSYPIANTTATTRSRPTAHYATSREEAGSDRRSRRSLPAAQAPRRSRSPAYSVIKRVLRLPRGDREHRRQGSRSSYGQQQRHDFDEPEFGDRQIDDRPRPPPRPLRPRRPADVQSEYLDIEPNYPPITRRRDRDRDSDIRPSRPIRVSRDYTPTADGDPYYFEQQPPRRNLGRSATVRNGYGGRDRDRDEGWPDDRFDRVYDEVEKMRQVGARRVVPNGRTRSSARAGSVESGYGGYRLRA